MINRELIRTKIVQLTYAYYQNGSKNIESAEKELVFSLSKAYDLYNYLLALIVGITQESRRHLEVAQSRAKREGTEMPSQKFAFNRFAMQLESNKMLNEFMENQKTTWNDEPEFLKKLDTQISESQIYNDYMNSKRVDFMANLLRQNPTQNQKQLFFAAGFRSYPTAHRNFVKFKGCSPTEYIGKFS